MEHHAAHHLLPNQETTAPQRPESIDEELSPPSKSAIASLRGMLQREELSLLSKIVGLVCAMVFAVPIAALLTHTESLSRALDATGCLPDGSFAIPGTSSIWDKAHFLSINVPVSPGGSSLWSFTTAKAVDVVWDMIIGRGIQVCLGLMALHTFYRVILRLMEGEELPFRTYAAISFQPGSFVSAWRLLGAVKHPKVGLVDPETRKHTGPDISYRSFHAQLLLISMGLVTLYIVALPTLLSAATGYSSESYLILSYWPGPPKNQTADRYLLYGMDEKIGKMCDSPDNQFELFQGLMPAWGFVLDAERLSHSDGVGTFYDYPDYVAFGYPTIDKFLDYYLRYKWAYDALATDPACADVRNTSLCQATNISSTFISSYDHGPPVNLTAPLLNLHVLAPFNSSSWQKGATFTPSADTNTMPDAWVCDSGLFWHRDFTTEYIADHAGSQPNLTATCSFAGADGGSGGNFYRWGFSFHLLLAICVMNLAAALGFYGLWLYGNGQRAGTRRERETFHQVQAAVDIVEQARVHYGNDAVDGTWGPRLMEKNIYKGWKGIKVETDKTMNEERAVGRRREWSQESSQV